MGTEQACERMSPEFWSSFWLRPKGCSNRGPTPFKPFVLCKQKGCKGVVITARLWAQTKAEKWITPIKRLLFQVYEKNQIQGINFCKWKEYENEIKIRIIKKRKN